MDLKKRIPTALVLLTVVFISVQYFPRLGFFLVLQVIILAALLEFYNLPRKKSFFPARFLGVAIAVLISLSFYFEEISLAVAIFVSFLVAGFYYILAINRLEKLVHFPSSISLTFFGALYLCFTLNYLFLIREQYGAFAIYFLLAVIFIGDTGAYIIGKLWGKHPYVPMASPPKTWEGSIGGIIFACLGGVAVQQILFQDKPMWKLALFAFLIHTVAQVSDPLESLFKRAVGIKDSSNILPGHGGFLDRIDSLILASPLFYYLIQILGMD